MHRSPYMVYADTSVYGGGYDDEFRLPVLAFLRQYVAIAFN